MPDPSVLLTNDDGVAAPGLAALREALEPVADVTIVAPAEDRSGVGRRNSREAAVIRCDDAIALDGTPAACVHAGLDRYVPETDLVVAGCNPGPNIGEHVLGRSGTVGLALEAAFYDVPGLAVSLYDHPEGGRAFDRGEYALAAKFARFAVAEGLPRGLFAESPALNVNMPANPPDRPDVRVTRPGAARRIETTLSDGVLEFRDAFYDGIDPSQPGEMDHPEATDVRACYDHDISVTPVDPRFRTPEIQAGVVERFKRWAADA